MKRRFPKYKTEVDSTEWAKNHDTAELYGVYETGRRVFDTTEEDYYEMVEEGIIDEESGELMCYLAEKYIALAAERFGIWWTDIDDLQEQKVDYRARMKALHDEICTEIAGLMLRHHVRKMKLMESDAARTCVLMEDKFTDNVEEVEVDKVFLNDENEVEISSCNWSWTGETINIKYNRHIKPLSIVDLYDTVYEELVING